MGRGKQHGGRQVVPINVGHTQVHHEERTCPLCIELLDATEKQFFPCPCGYQVCLFCFERIKRDCSNLCPGCRTEYGSEKDPFQKGEAPHRDTSAPSSCGATPQKARAANSQRSSPMPSPSNRQTMKAQRAGTRSEQSTSPVNHAPEPSSIPSQPRNTQGHRSVAAQGDDAWGSTRPAGQGVAAEKDEVVGQPSSQRHLEDVTVLAGPHSIDGMRAEGMSEQGPTSRFRWPIASEALQSVVTRVGWGSWRFQKRRPEISTSDPEGAALTSAAKQAVREGRISSSQGAAQLLSFLQQREAQQGVAAAQEVGRSSAARGWPGTVLGGATPAPDTEQRHGNGVATPQESSGWAVNGGALEPEHAEGLSRFSGLFAAPAEHSSGSASASGGRAYRAYQNGY